MASGRRRVHYLSQEVHMPMPLSDDVKQLLDGPNFAHLATLMSDGSPQSAPVWVTREG
ncbi:MAG TPA: pyridoxamine 5'-phosphate oxidase family protein, partial [Methylomirabilota bacterium]|nr:pyridoxamine 5'-phosphate oxidase family protein [Methylomirabilota bacterium]